MDAAANIPQKHSLMEAQLRATELKFMLESLCYELELAGSVRRRCPTVKDIEFVCIPKFKLTTVPGELFRKVNTNRVINWIDDKHNHSVYRIKGGDKYQQIIYNNVFQVDIFMTTPEQFGRMLAIRTGPAEYSKKMAVRWTQLGFKGINGELVNQKDGHKPEFPTEQSFFEFLGWQFVKPEARL